jgi:hypothetical protein
MATAAGAAGTGTGGIAVGTGAAGGPPIAREAPAGIAVAPTAAASGAGGAGTSRDTAALPFSISIVYTEMSEADQNLVATITANALKSQEKSEKTMHQKDLAQMIKIELDQQKGLVKCALFTV